MGGILRSNAPVLERGAEIDKGERAGSNERFIGQWDREERRKTNGSTSTFLQVEDIFET